MAFVAFLIALILLIVNTHTDWVIWLVVIGGLLLSFGAGVPSNWMPWRK